MQPRLCCACREHRRRQRTIRRNQLHWSAPYGPGGASDLHARIVAGAAPAYLKQAVLVINKTGAAGVVGSTFVVKGKKDGYTLLSARVGCQAGVPAMNPNIPYKWDDFTFLGLTERNPFVLVVKKGSPYKSFKDFETALKGGKKLSYSSAGVGSAAALGIFGDGRQDGRRCQQSDPCSL